MRKQRPKEVKQLSSGYTSVKLWDLEIDQVYLTSSNHIWMWGLDYKESWAPKNWCFWTVVLEKTFESPLECKEIQPVHPKGDQSWIFLGKTDAEAKTPILWSPCKELTHWKRPWCSERSKAGGEGDNRGWDGWMASLTRWTWVCASSGAGDGQGSLACCSSWVSQRVGHDWVTELNWTEPDFRVKILKHHSVETGHPSTDEGCPRLYTAASYKKLEQRERQKS